MRKQLEDDISIDIDEDSSYDDEYYEYTDIDVMNIDDIMKDINTIKQRMDDHA